MIDEVVTSGATVARDWFARNSSNPPKISRKTRSEIYRRDGGRCVVCKSESDLTLDHITPTSKGGGNEAENLQTMCRSCNSRKGAGHGPRGKYKCGKAFRLLALSKEAGEAA